MAKQRPQDKPRAHRPSAAKSHQAGSLAAAATAPARRTTYFEAVALYEKALATVQKHDYKAAIEQLESVLKLYPEEKELHERVRLYLNVCQRQITPREPTPRTVDERLYAATLALNGGRHEEAISHLRLVRDEAPDNDHALYMLAVALTSRGEHAEAVAHLQRAIALNSDNRSLARKDPDLEPLWDDDGFRLAVGGGNPGDRPIMRPRPARGRSAR